MQLFPRVNGTVDFQDEVRGYAVVSTDHGRVLVRASAVLSFGDWFLCGYDCVLGDVHEGRDQRLVAAYVVSAEQPDGRLRGWQPVRGKFYNNTKAFGFVTTPFGDAYVSGTCFGASGIPAVGFKGGPLEAVMFKRENRLHSHRLRQIAGAPK